MFRIADFLVANILSVVASLLLEEETKCLLANVKFIKTEKCSEEDMHALVRALVVAEDKRFFVHTGIDSRGVVRAIYLYVTSGKIQGASTVTQQLVRVLTGDYRKSLRRKAKEMCLACAIDKAVPKREQAELYLRIAYYGWRMNGCAQAMRHLHHSSPLTASAAAGIVARLRYPQSSHPSPVQMELIKARTKYIELQTK